MSVNSQNKMVETPPNETGVYWTGVPQNYFLVNVFWSDGELIVETVGDTRVNVEWIPLSDYNVSGWKWSSEPVSEPFDSDEKPLFENGEKIDLHETIESLEDSIKKARKSYAPYG